MTRLSVLGVAGAVSLSWLALAGCGGGDGSGAACGVTPCGGDITGAWNAADVCLDKAMLTADFMVEGCPQASVGDINFTPTGNFMFNTDGTYNLGLALNGTIGLNYPVSCLEGATCVELDAAVKLAMLLEPNPAIQSVSCAGTSTCVCTFVATPETLAEAGTYTTSGNNLVTTPSGQPEDTIEYSVKGTTATLREPNDGTSSEVTAFILERQ